MTTDARFQAARLTDYELTVALGRGQRGIADAATRKALDHEDARRKALVEALEAVVALNGRVFLTKGAKAFVVAVEQAQAALRKEEAS